MFYKYLYKLESSESPTARFLRYRVSKKKIICFFSYIFVHEHDYLIKFRILGILIMKTSIINLVFCLLLESTTNNIVPGFE